MATVLDHKAKAGHNTQFSASVDDAIFPDWVVVGLFYVAVHMAEALIVHTGHATGSHIKRNKLLRDLFPDVWRHYQPLYAFSRLARYRCVQVRPEDLKLVRRRFGKFETEITRLLP